MNVIYRGALPEDTEEMSRLIAAQNQQVERHVGYCGIHAAEIHHTLRQEFDKEKLERDFTLALFGNRMVGVLGFDLDPDTGLAEIWGPFIGWEDEDFQQKFAGEAGHRAALIDGLWAAALGRTEREPFRLQGFYHRDNTEAESLMLRSGASLTGQHLTLALRCEEVQGEVQGDVKRAESGIIELSPAWADPFVQLHDEAFPGSYASGSTLLDERDAEHRLIGYVREGRLLGYAYLSGSRSFAEGDIEFLAAAPEARGQGIGSALLQASLRILFEQFAPAEVRLTVSASNQAAIGLYRKYGFRIREEMNVYELRISRNSPGASLDFLRG